jgi:histidine triad (HIT) family protein
MTASERTIFEKIIHGEIPAEKVYEDDAIIAIKDLYPKAPVHLLIIPKKVIPDIQSMRPEDFPLIPQVIAVAQTLATRFGIAKGYRLLTNNGSDAGQTIFHLHFHLLGGHQLGPMG